MKVSRVDLYNLALGNIKIGRKVGSLDDETAREFMLPQNYDGALATLMSMYDWSFATVSTTLARVADAPVVKTATAAWNYGWAYPSDCVRILEVGTVTGHSGDGNAWQFEYTEEWPWTVENRLSSRILRTAHGNACARYLSDAVPPTDWPPAFVLAFTWILAANITRAVNADDRDADYRMKQAEYYIQQAKIADAEEIGRAAPRPGGWLEARNG
ncbi:MAG: hypothetical protein LUG50_03460 [Planctomycetaceae bacterium]|nr:hypothetical protein [Planctomycetaceae bacterium]